MIFAIANIGVWGGVGFNMLVIYTALRAIPRELYEAARIDGCSELQIAWRIKIPLVRARADHDHSSSRSSRRCRCSPSRSRCGR